MYSAIRGKLMAELLTLPRMARRLGVTQRWLREKTDAGTVPALKAGSRYLYSPEAVANALVALASQAATSRGGQY